MAARPTWASLCRTRRTRSCRRPHLTDSPIFVATGDEGARRLQRQRRESAPAGSNPVAQVVDATTGTAYVANRGSNTVSVDSEGTTGNPSNFVHVELGAHRDAAGRVASIVVRGGLRGELRPGRAR